MLYSAAALPLPTGAATAANQPVLSGDGGALAHVTNFPTTQAVSATALPLPTGAATAANQTAVQGATGVGVPANGVYVGMNVGGALTGLTGTANGLSVDGSAVTQPVSAATLPLPSNAAQETGGNLARIATNQPALSGDGGAFAHVTNFPTTQAVSATALPLPTGAATAANQTAAQGATGVGVPANGVYVGMNVGGALTGLTGTANGLSVDGSAVTQPVSAATLPLPSNAAQETGGTWRGSRPISRPLAAMAARSRMSPISQRRKPSLRLPFLCPRARQRLPIKQRRKARPASGSRRKASMSA